MKAFHLDDRFGTFNLSETWRTSWTISSLSFKKLSSTGEQFSLVSVFDFPVTDAEAPLKEVAFTGGVDCMWCQVGYKTYFKWMEKVPLRHVKSNCRSAFETEKGCKSAADRPRLRWFCVVKVMELTCHNLAGSCSNRISGATSDMFYALSSPRTSQRRRLCLWVHVTTPTLELRCATVSQPKQSSPSAAFPEQGLS